MRLVLRSRAWKPATGSEELIGEVGEVRERVSPQDGMVFVHGELWRAHAASAIPEGARIRVRSVDGLTLHVEPVDASVNRPVA